MAIVVEEGFFAFGKRADGANVNICIAQCGKEFVIPAGVLLLDHAMGFFCNGRNLFFGQEAIGTVVGNARFYLLEQSRYAHFKKFVEVVGYNAQEFDPFQ